MTSSCIQCTGNPLDNQSRECELSDRVLDPRCTEGRVGLAMASKPRFHPVVVGPHNTARSVAPPS